MKRGRELGEGRFDVRLPAKSLGPGGFKMLDTAAATLRSAGFGPERGVVWCSWTAYLSLREFAPSFTFDIEGLIHPVECKLGR